MSPTTGSSSSSDAGGVRRATPADATALAEIAVRGWRFAYRGLLSDAILEGLSITEREDALRRYLAREIGADERPWVVEREGRVSGFARCGPARDPDLPEGCGELYALYVEPDLIGRGLGRALCSHAVDELESRGYDLIVVWVLDGNERALRFYGQAGFRPDGANRLHETGAAEIRLVRRT